MAGEPWTPRAVALQVPKQLEPSLQPWNRLPRLGKDKLPTVKAALEPGLGGVCTLASGHGGAGHSLPRAGGLEGVCVWTRPGGGRRTGARGTDYSMARCALIDLEMLQRLTSKGKQSRTQIPPLHTWANPGVTAAGVGFISPEDLCPGGKGDRAGGGSPARLRARGCPPRLRTRMCAPICCTAHSHVLPRHMHL